MEGYCSQSLENGAPEVVNATVAFTEAMKSNHQLSSKVGNVLANFLRIRLDGDELFE